jgi:perosamine synthetase
MQTTENSSRRAFIQSGIGAFGLAASGKAALTKEPLAIHGGPRTVTISKEIQKSLNKWPRYGEAEKKALHDMIDANKFYDEAPIFEKEWKGYIGMPFAKAHMNGTSAITSMYFALDLPPGSEILVPSYTWFGDSTTMRFFGYVPIFVDVDPKTACFDLDDAKRKLTRNTKAIFPTHTWGVPCELDRLQSFAKEKGLILVEDCSHAHGASMQGKKVGSWGQISVFSFQASKALPAVEGGMGLYQSREHFERAAAFGEYKDPETFPKDSPMRAYAGSAFQKYRMHPFAAAIVRQQFKGLDERNVLVKANVRALNRRLLELPGITEPRLRPDQERVYYYANGLFLDEAKAGFKREAMLKALQAEGVPVGTWELEETHSLKVFSEAKWWHHLPQIPASLPGTTQVNKTHFLMPLCYDENPELIDQYAKGFEKVWAHRDALAKM